MSFSRFDHGKVYQCLYCKKRFISTAYLVDHESKCPMRAQVESGWRRELDRARRREAEIVLDIRSRAELELGVGSRPRPGQAQEGGVTVVPNPTTQEAGHNGKEG